MPFLPPYRFFFQFYYTGDSTHLYTAFPNIKVAFSNIPCYTAFMIEFYETSYDMAAKRNADMEPILFGHEDCTPSHAYAFLHDVYSSKHPLFKVEYIGCSIRVQARSFWRWYSEGDPSLAEGF